MNKIILVTSLVDGSRAQAYRVYSSKGVCPCLTTNGGGNREPKFICIKQKKDMW